MPLTIEDTRKIVLLSAIQARQNNADPTPILAVLKDEDELLRLAAELSASLQESVLFEEQGKTGVYRDSAGRRYRLEDGKRVPLGDVGDSGGSDTEDSDSPKLPEKVIQSVKSFLAAPAHHTARMIDVLSDALLLNADEMGSILFGSRSAFDGAATDPVSQATGLSPMAVAKIVSGLVVKVHAWIKNKVSGGGVQESERRVSDPVISLASLLHTVATELGAEPDPVEEIAARLGKLRESLTEAAKGKKKEPGSMDGVVQWDVAGRPYKMMDGKRVKVSPEEAEAAKKKAGMEPEQPKAEEPSSEEPSSEEKKAKFEAENAKNEKMVRDFVFNTHGDPATLAEKFRDPKEALAIIKSLNDTDGALSTKWEFAEAAIFNGDSEVKPSSQGWDRINTKYRMQIDAKSSNRKGGKNSYAYEDTIASKIKKGNEFKEVVQKTGEPWTPKFDTLSSSKDGLFVSFGFRPSKTASTVQGIIDLSDPKSREAGLRQFRRQYIKAIKANDSRLIPGLKLASFPSGGKGVPGSFNSVLNLTAEQIQYIRETDEMAMKIAAQFAPRAQKMYEDSANAIVGSSITEAANKNTKATIEGIRNSDKKKEIIEGALEGDDDTANEIAITQLMKTGMSREKARKILKLK